MSILRLAIAGSVDDGKSTLLGRLLHDTGSLRTDQVAKMTRIGADKGMALDLASVADGLKAEQEQGITIDVAYRYLNLRGRRLILADTPGHEQYTRNMFTGASTAWGSLLLVDAKRGLREQTRRHASIAALLGHDTVVFCVNKMDAVDNDPARYQALADECQALGERLGFKHLHILPISALTGDNVVTRGALTWWEGDTLLDVLTALEPAARAQPAQVASVQAVMIEQSEGQTRRLLALRFAGGPIAVGDRLFAGVHARPVTIKAIYSGGASVTSVASNRDALVELDEEIDLTRGDWLQREPQTWTKTLSPVVCWLGERPGRVGEKVVLRHGDRWVKAQITDASQPVDLAELCYHSTQQSLESNSIGRIHLRLAQPVPAASFADDPVSGAMVLVDPATRQTLAAGVIAPIPGLETTA